MVRQTFDTAASILAIHRDPALAEEQLRKLLETDPDNPNINNHIVKSLIQQTEFEKALKTASGLFYSDQETYLESYKDAILEVGTYCDIEILKEEYDKYKASSISNNKLEDCFNAHINPTKITMFNGGYGQSRI